MTPSLLLRGVRLGVCLLATAVALPVHAQAPRAGPTPLTPADLLAYRSVAIGDYSPDGKWLVVRISTRGDGLGYVAARESDPSYTRPSPSRVLLMNTATGDTTVIVNTPRTVGSMAWSRDGARLAIATRDSTPALLIYEMGTKRLRQQALGGARLAENTALKWTTDGRLLLSVREQGWLPEVRARFDSLVGGPISVQIGTEPFLAWDMLRRMGNRSMVVAVTLPRGTLDTLVAPTQISQWTANASGSVLTWREDRNTKTNYEGGATNESRTMIRTGAGNGIGNPRVLIPSMRGINVSFAEDGERYAYAKEGAIYVASTVASAGDTTPRRIIGPAPRAAGDTARAAPDSAARNRVERYTLVRMAPTGDAVVASTRAGLWLVNTTSGARTSLSAITDTVRGPRVTLSEWSLDGRTLYLSYASRMKWDRAIMRYDVDRAAMDTLVHDGRLYGSPSLSPDGTRLALTIAANGGPADIWLAGNRMDGAKRVIESNPQWASRTLPVTQLVSYLDADGKSQFGVLLLPYANARNLPTVFSVYEDFFDDSFDATSMYLASNGYAVMKPSVSFDIGYPGEAWLKGVTASANKLIEMGIADSSKLGVHGTSYGGFATNLIITQTTRFKAAINVSGKVDMISFYTDSPRLGVRNVNAAEKTQDRIGATLWEQPQKYVQQSAVMFADRIKTPLLLLTGGEDHNVPALNTREMYFALRRLGKPVEWVNYTNGGHGIPMTNAVEFTDWHNRLLGWYDRYLKPTAVVPTP